MARTKDPGAATTKAWKTRERKKKEAAAGAGTTSRDDWRATEAGGITGKSMSQSIRSEPTVGEGDEVPDVDLDSNGDGVTDASRVGVPGDAVPPPPKVPRLPNLDLAERQAETAFAEAFEADPDGMARKFLEMNKASGKPNTFETDAAKNLFEPWAGTGLSVDERAVVRSTLNTALHQTANAIAKRAFLMHLDSLSAEEKAKGMLVTVGGCGCHAPGTMVMLAGGTTRTVEDVRVGDRLMGPDSRPREVLRTIHGVGQMYRVVPTKGEPFIVNEDHVLSLRTTRARGSLKRSRLVTVEVRVKDQLRRGKSAQRASMLYRVGVEFPVSPVPLNPYFLGLWLGDGTGINTTITTADPEVAAFVATMAESTPGVRLAVRDKKDNKAKGYQMVAAHAGRQPGGDYATNPVLAGLRECGVSPERRAQNDGGNDRNGSRLKHIPAQYLHNSREVRLELLAGLLDSDGHMHGAGFDIVTRWRAIADGLAALVRSLGMACYVSPCRKRAQTGFVGNYYRLSISGDTHLIPTRIAHKRAPTRRQKRTVLHTGFTLQHLGEGGYYGFTLEGDGRYLLRDFTVTHNSGKGFSLKVLSKNGMPEFDTTRYGAVWDSAGDQNATENPWLLAEAKKRGIKVTYAYVSADPEVSWADEKRGVVARASGTNDGRMVDATVFADSYVIGARNHAAFSKRHARDASFLFIHSGDEIKRL
ncbi:MAG TPA: Hint domain-containing homing endonuclease, partial [Planctomycetota bacterium]|nr:Hint domain-containing homing endonuclease [Planctomycetota bacterium]